MKIIILEPIGLSLEKITQIKADFKSSGHELINYADRPENDLEIIKRAKDADVLVLSNLPISNEVISECKSLKMISVAFAGVDHIPMNLCQEKNIIVSNSAGYSNHAVAELTIGAAISLYRKIILNDTQTRKLSTREGFLGSELFGKTFGIVGAGQIGLEVARLANAFGCIVLAYSKTNKNIPYIKFLDFEDLLKKSDIISLHVPLTDETNGLINQEKIKLIKHESIIINTARGPIIDYSALTKALIDNKIAGAAIDVYENEPPLNTNHPLLKAPNVILLPHIGYATKEAIELRSNIVIENIHKWLNGNPQNVMN